MSDYTAPYPYPSGYAQLADVAARINAGTWNPFIDSTSSPTASQVTQFLVEATAEVDLALRKTGYFVPLQMQDGQPSQIPDVILIKLRIITAALATATVEKIRHGSQEQDADRVGNEWETLADDLLARLEAGADNFAQFGLGGDFLPQADQSRGATWTGQNDLSGNQSAPIFYRGQIF